MTTKPLTAREARFVEAYRLHGNAMRAAREAGYTAKQPSSIGWNVLRKPKIIAALRAHGIEIVLPKRKDLSSPGRQQRYTRKGLTVLQERFVAEYLIDGNAKEAAIRAGLSAKNSTGAGSTMLHRREVAAAIERERASREARLKVTADRVVAELARIAFADIGDVADWGRDGVILKEKETLSKHDRAAIAELSSEKTGAKKTQVRMHSKQRALDALAKHLGLYGAGTRTIAKVAESDHRYRDELIARLRRIAQGAEEPTAASGVPPAPSAAPETS